MTYCSAFTAFPSVLKNKLYKKFIVYIAVFLDVYTNKTSVPEVVKQSKAVGISKTMKKKKLFGAPLKSFEYQAQDLDTKIEFQEPFIVSLLCKLDWCPPKLCLKKQWLLVLSNGCKQRC